MSWLTNLDARTIGAMVPVVAIIIGGVYIVTKAVFRHRERMAMIERGILPPEHNKDSESLES